MTYAELSRQATMAAILEMEIRLKDSKYFGPPKPDKPLRLKRRSSGFQAPSPWVGQSGHWHTEQFALQRSRLR